MEASERKYRRRSAAVAAAPAIERYLSHPVLMNCEFLLQLDESRRFCIVRLAVAPGIVRFLWPFSFCRLPRLASTQNEVLSRVGKLRHGRPAEEDYIGFYPYQTRELLVVEKDVGFAFRHSDTFTPFRI
jgi:hypothetical protein